MDVETATTLGRAAIRSISHFRANRITYPKNRIGRILVHPDGDRYTVYRETTLSAEEPIDGVILVFRMVVANDALGTKTRFALYHRFANVATPFFAGLPGFRRKLWLAGEQQGDFLELYEWSTEADASRLITILDALLGPFDEFGSATFEIVPHDSIHSFVDKTSYAWEAAPSDTRETSVIRQLVLVAGVLGVSYLVWRVFSRKSKRSE